MGTILASAVVSRAATLLQDTTHIRWAQSELLQWMNDGQRELVLYKPDACYKIETLALVGGTKQTLPAACNTLIGITRNMGTDGNTPGAVIREVSKSLLDAQLPNWHKATPNAVVQHYMYSATVPKNFYVYPPQPATGGNRVEIVYSALPVDAAITDPISVDDVYMTALINYTLYRAFGKDAEHPANVNLASAYYQAFVALLGGKAQGEARAEGSI